ncbi:hypothetical protein HMPREF1982_00694 [Clostridiales bacterium oral taxon 876 str. F0540]|nr:hypothetical protein HMPREF1982_00694 [Clostridiales bacterium oral taxon 876 str. F0540]
MKFFSKSRLKLRKEIINESVKFYVDYSNLKDKTEFKNRLFTNLINEESCIIVIDSKLQQNDSNQEKLSDELEDYLSKNSITYEKAEDKGSESVSVLGVSIKLDSKNRPKNYIIAFKISAKVLNKARDFINNYNTRFYIGFTNEDIESLDSIIKIYKSDEVILDEKFKCSIFDNNLLESMVVLSESVYSDKVKNIIEQAAN